MPGGVLGPNSCLEPGFAGVDSTSVKFPGAPALGCSVTGLAVSFKMPMGYLEGSPNRLDLKRAICLAFGG